MNLPVPHQSPPGAIYRCALCNATSELKFAVCGNCEKKRKLISWEKDPGSYPGGLTRDMIIVGMLLAIKTFTFLVVTVFILLNIVGMVYSLMKAKFRVGGCFIS